MESETYDLIPCIFSFHNGSFKIHASRGFSPLCHGMKGKMQLSRESRTCLLTVFARWLVDTVALFNAQRAKFAQARLSPSYFKSHHDYAWLVYRHQRQWGSTWEAIFCCVREQCYNFIRLWRAGSMGKKVNRLRLYFSFR